SGIEATQVEHMFQVRAATVSAVRSGAADEGIYSVLHARTHEGARLGRGALLSKNALQSGSARPIAERFPHRGYGGRAHRGSVSRNFNRLLRRAQANRGRAHR